MLNPLFFYHSISKITLHRELSHISWCPGRIRGRSRNSISAFARPSEPRVGQESGTRDKWKPVWRHAGQTVSRMQHQHADRWRKQSRSQRFVLDSVAYWTRLVLIHVFLSINKSQGKKQETKFPFPVFDSQPKDHYHLLRMQIFEIRSQIYSFIFNGKKGKEILLNGVKKKNTG